MTESQRCPVCGSRLPDAGPASGEGVFCVTCGGVVRPQATDWNPYAAPAADLIDRGEESLRPRAVPRSLVGKLALTLGLLASNLPLLGAIVLTVWLPANVLIEVVMDEVPVERQQAASYQLNLILTTVFGPVVMGALVYATARRLDGHRVRYGEAMAVGLRRWGSLFVANFHAGIRVMLGFIALIIPGIILSVRYSLLGPAVVLEQASDPRGRSAELTQGRGWPIFLTTVLSTALDYAFVWISTRVVEQVEAFDTLEGYVTLDCVESLLASLWAIAMVVFYAEARQAESGAKIAGVADDPLAD